MLYHFVPACITNGEEHEEVAVRDDSKRDEEHEAAEHQGVALVCWSGRHIIPCAGCHEAFWDIGTYQRTITTQCLRLWRNFKISHCRGGNLQAPHDLI